MTRRRPREWDATAYDRLPIPMTRWGTEVVGWLELRGDERVLDAGCGTGRVTALLHERLPRGTVIALDASRAMVARARERLGDERVTYLVRDLQDEIPIDPPVDAILSTATFHWIQDHERLFANLATVLRSGGQLAAQCGGEGNIAAIERALTELGRGLTNHYASPAATEARLVAAGFVDVETWAHPEPVELAADVLEPYLEAICLGDQVRDMEPEERRSFVHEVARRLPERVIDYVRLNIRARRHAEVG